MTYLVESHKLSKNNKCIESYIMFTSNTPFTTLTGQRHDRMMKLSRQIASKRSGNLTFNHSAMIFPAHQHPLIKGMSGRL